MMLCDREEQRVETPVVLEVPEAQLLGREPLSEEGRTCWPELPREFRRKPLLEPLAADVEERFRLPSSPLPAALAPVSLTGPSCSRGPKPEWRRELLSVKLADDFSKGDRVRVRPMSTGIVAPNFALLSESD